MACCDNSNERLLCHCFSISKRAYLQALVKNAGHQLKNFVIWQTKHNYCNCENLSPDKVCCLKAFKKIEKQFKNEKTR